MSFYNDMHDTLNKLDLILESENKSRRRLAEEEEAPAYQKELDAETVMFDCDAENCKFWNEGFKGNCVLKSVEINAKAGCAQYQPKEEAQEESEQVRQNASNWRGDGCENYDDAQDVCLDDDEESFDLFPIDEEEDFDEEDGYEEDMRPCPETNPDKYPGNDVRCKKIAKGTDPDDAMAQTVGIFK